MSDIVVVLVEVVLSLQEFKLGLDTGYIVARSYFKLAGIQEDTKLAFESTSDVANYTYGLPASDSSNEWDFQGGSLWGGSMT